MSNYDKKMSTANLIDIHNSIIDSFNKEKALVDGIKTRVSELQSMYDNDLLNSRIKNEIVLEIRELERRRDAITSNEDFYFYILQSTTLINEYKKELAKPIEVNFMGKTTEPDTRKLDSIYQKIIKLIQNIYPNLACESQLICSDVCPTCNNKAKESIIDISNIAVCECGTEKDSLQMTFSYKDSDRVNVTSKYTYDRRIHFRECINQFQGKQNSTIKPAVYEKLIEQLALHGLVRAEECPQSIKFEKVAKYHISTFLKEIGFANHYEDLNLIYHVITGNTLDDISYLEDTLMDDFDKLSKIYDDEYIKTKKISRKNFINTQYVLYQLLKRHKYQCELSDFTFLKTNERKSFHDEICSNLFRKLGWNFHACF